MKCTVILTLQLYIFLLLFIDLVWFNHACGSFVKPNCCFKKKNQVPKKFHLFINNAIFLLVLSVPTGESYRIHIPTHEKGKHSIILQVCKIMYYMRLSQFLYS